MGARGSGGSFPNCHAYCHVVVCRIIDNHDWPLYALYTTRGDPYQGIEGILVVMGPRDRADVPINQPGDYRIEVAASHHIPRIAAMAKAFRLEELSPEQAKDYGFLVSDFEEEDYRDFLHRANHFYVLLQNRKLLGFMLAYSSDRIQDDEWLNLLIKSRHPDDFVLIKQICIQPEVTGRGLATSLYQYLVSQVQGCPLFAAIALEPVNHGSIAFHERHGFRKVFQATPPDGIRRDVWMQNP